MHWSYRELLERAKWPTTKSELYQYLDSQGAPHDLLLILEELMEEEGEDEQEYTHVEQMFDELPSLGEYYHGEDD